ncbi:MAG: class I SAM-dependent methyltransferase [Solirubrobacteraceae bacterium]
MPAREWDGASYDRISATMEAFGLEVLARLDLHGEERVLDAGCGSGRITEALIERLPRGHVIAIDESPSMVDAARKRLRAYAAASPGGAESPDPRVEIRVGDLLALELDQPVDAILSTATFHWIADHERLFSRLRGALRPGGRLVAQCGGEGNIEMLRAKAAEVLSSEPFARHFADWSPPWYYAGASQTRERLLDAGFSSARCWLAAAPREPEQPREFLSTIVLGPAVQRLPAELRGRFMDAVLARVGEPVVVDYVRLNIDASA